MALDSFDLIDLWAESMVARGLSERTIQLYSYGVFRLAREVVRGDIRGTTPAQINHFLAGLADRATAKSKYALGIRQLFTFLHEGGYMLTNPAGRIRVKKPRHRPPVALTEEELIRYHLAAAARAPRRAWTLMLAFGQGLRRSELAGIRPEDVQGNQVEVLGKGAKIRRVELTYYGLRAIEELRPWSNGTILGGLDPQTVTAWAKDAAIESGLYPKVRYRPAHVLRASYATHLLRSGVPVEVVRDLLGHESISTTNTYAVALNEDREAAAEQLRFPDRPGLQGEGARSSGNRARKAQDSRGQRLRVSGGAGSRPARRGYLGSAAFRRSG